MTNFERSSQFWGVLALAARFRHTVTYREMEQMTGLPRHFQNRTLANILDYCAQHGLPRLTCIVVEQATGVPASNDFQGLDISAETQRVFDYDWLSHGAPSPADFQEASIAATDTAAAV